LHILPDLVRLEAKYPGVLVVVGVHSPKFPHEKKTAAIRKAVLRYNVDHPVVNDQDGVLWRGYGVQYWPTFVLIDPEGRFRGKINGEGLYKQLDNAIGKLVSQYRGRGLVKTPLHFDLEREQIKGPLFFPGKVLADAAKNRLFIADSSNNRIVVTDLTGNKIAVAGTGKEGYHDGSFSEATFADPQGLAFDGDNILYVADRKNHVIRTLDFKAQTVKTIAGTGKQDHLIANQPPPYRFRAAKIVGLNSPWGLVLAGNVLYIGMSGHHQIWAMDLRRKVIGPYAGDSDENIQNGPLARAKFAQPSGLGTDGKFLFVADSESSGIRALPMGGQGQVQTIVGAGLFEFGDKEGNGPAERFQVRLQHPLDVVFHNGMLYVADTYNNKIKLIDPTQGSCSTFAGTTPGEFDEPGGLSIAGGKMYVADTSAHRIRVVDMQTKAVSTLEIQGVAPVHQGVTPVSSKK
jgi:DNA-binding beta-propeller fold protein YncE